MRTITLTSGPAAGETLELEPETVIGREGADLTIGDPELSRRHLLLRPVDEGVEVEDLGSLNGTFVNGSRIEGAVTLESDAKLRAGVTEIELAISIPEPEPASPEAPLAQPDVTAPRADPGAGRDGSAEDPAAGRDGAAGDPAAGRDGSAGDPGAGRDGSAGDPAAGRDGAARIPEPDVTAPRAIPQPDVTAPRAIPSLDLTAVRPSASPPEAAEARRPAPAAPAARRLGRPGPRRPCPRRRKARVAGAPTSRARGARHPDRRRDRRPDRAARLDPGGPVSIEENKTVVTRVVDEMWNRGDESAVDSLIAPGMVSTAPSGPGQAAATTLATPSAASARRSLTSLSRRSI